MSSHSTEALSRRNFIAAAGAMTCSRALASEDASAETFRAASTTEFEYGMVSRLTGHEPIPLAASNIALIIVDMQRYFVHPTYPFTQTWEKVSPGCSAEYFERVGKVVVPTCQELQRCFRAANAMIIYTAFGSIHQDGRDMPLWAREDNALSRSVIGKPMYPCSKDPSWQIDDSLAPMPQELVLAKSTSGPLNSTKLDQMLRTLGIDTLVVAGVVTDVCVTQTAREFADRDFKVLVVEDACASFSEARHHGSLQTFAGVFGRVCAADAIMQALTT